MGHIRDQSPLQRALQTLFRGLGSGAQQFSGFNQGQIDREFQQQQLADAAGRRARAGESALSKALLDRESQGVRDRATARQRATTSAQTERRIGISQGNLDLARARFEAGRTQPPKPVLTPSQTGTAVEKRLGEKRKDIFGQAEQASGFQIRNLSDLQAASQEGLGRTSGGFLGFGQSPDPDSTLFQLLQQLQAIGSPESRRATADSLQFLRPDIFRQGGGQPQQRQDTTVTPDEALQELRRRGQIP